jgi:hypothetical protein
LLQIWWRLSGKTCVHKDSEEGYEPFQQKYAEFMDAVPKRKNTDELTLLKPLATVTAAAGSPAWYFQASTGFRV